MCLNGNYEKRHSRCDENTPERHAIPAAGSDIVYMVGRMRVMIGARSRTKNVQEPCPVLFGTDFQIRLHDMLLMIWSDGSEFPIDADREPRKDRGHAKCFP
jgi:hypothetical protein